MASAAAHNQGDHDNLASLLGSSRAVHLHTQWLIVHQSNSYKLDQGGQFPRILSEDPLSSLIHLGQKHSSHFRLL